MTTAQVNAFNALYLAILIAVILLARPTVRRIAGALAGGASAGVAMLAVVAVCERAGWWRFVFPWEPYFLTLVVLGMTFCGFGFLLTWRVARRFGTRGLALLLFIAAVLGPVRDYRYMATFPEWGSYAPGYAPALAISAAYVIIAVVGHGVMRLIAGPASADRLADRPWKTV